MPSGYNMANSAGGQGLASVAAQQGFARGAAMQEQTHHQAQIDMGMKAGLGGRIRDVWKSMFFALDLLRWRMAVLQAL